MKLLFASDIHGSAAYCTQMLDAYKKEKAEKLVLLGDLLYHGPRNDLPLDYAPKKVLAMLNECKEELLCVRGNCEAEVDQMVLEFPVMADYMTIFERNHLFFITHGHKFNKDNLPPLKSGDLLIHGHTHIQIIEQLEGGITYLNPGSVSIPKGGTVHGYMIYEDGVFTMKDLDGAVIDTYKL
ncbi:putative phosphoesterase [Lachnospiraceae bacterium TWA4]|nr:putative phosphoesterase [Lachnospiraceae bacterium TWA4]